VAVPAIEDTTDFIGWPWPDIEPFYRELEARPIDAAGAVQFLADWSALAERLDETNQRLIVATTRNTADAEAQKLSDSFFGDVYLHAQEADQRLKKKLLALGVEIEGFEVPLQKMRAEVNLFRQENLPLAAQEKKEVDRYYQTTGSQTVEWEGREVPLPELHRPLQDRDRSVRERAWRLSSERRLQDRRVIDEVWRNVLDLRLQMAVNAGYPDYRSFRWQQLNRFDYTPDDAKRFHGAIEEAVVPAAMRLLERRRRLLGLDAIRPWDLYVDPQNLPPLQPYRDVPELKTRTSAVFHDVDPQLGRYFDVMIRENLLDLESRKNKAQLGYCLPFNATMLPFIFTNTAQTHGDVLTLLHEGGHAFHVFEMRQLPYYWQRDIERIGAEFGEVGSMAMELLAAPYLSRAHGGFYSEGDAGRARVGHLESIITDWGWIAGVDAFQHWVYENPESARDPDACDDAYGSLMQRFIRGIDWSGLEEELKTDWRRIPHIFETPFYYLEYGLAQLGAVQIWATALEDQARAMEQYRDALQLGDTRSVPELFSAAGATLAFDAGTLRPAVDLIERTIGELE
jgi:oligoendopeptidase F